MAKPIRVLIVDDDILWRDALASALADLRDMEVCGTSPTGRLGLAKTLRLAPDLVLIASSLSDVSPVDFTRAVLEQIPLICVLVVASDDTLSADMAIRALEAGAFDFVLKPSGRCKEERVAGLRRLLPPKIRCCSIRRYSRMARRSSPGPAARPPEVRKAAALCVPAAPADVAAVVRRETFEAVLIGASTGGPEALSKLLPVFPASFPLPIVIVLHMPHAFTKRMAAALNQESVLTVTEGVDGDVLAPGHAYLAPGGLHTTVERGSRQRVLLKLIDEPPENGCKPAVDVLLRSAASVFRNSVLTVILTGMGEDGTKGLAALKQRQATVLVQDEETSVVWGMPGSVVRAGHADEVLPLDMIGGRVMQIVGCHG